MKLTVCLSFSTEHIFPTRHPVGKITFFYIGKKNGIEKHKQNGYLLMTLRELFDIINGADEIESVKMVFYKNLGKN